MESAMVPAETTSTCAWPAAAQTHDHRRERLTKRIAHAGNSDARQWLLLGAFDLAVGDRLSSNFTSE
ncbi:MAG: hypothetical protein CM1200mP29_05500 [Verrucomicrobiota bacterium]|nr:MAG: hypothetical protein CM1200mP29_05500 [Verrucomicrobiota bacterium]